MWRALSVVLALCLAAFIWLFGKMVEFHDRDMYLNYRLELRGRLLQQECDAEFQRDQYLSEELFKATRERGKRASRPF